jgi:hypothetical protein
MYGTNQIEAEDLFQEILLQLWKSWPAYQADSKIYNEFLYLQKSQRLPGKYPEIKTIPGRI